jgi:general secretion pathway protein M
MRAPAFWAARAPRERALLSAGIATAAVVLVVVLAWLPLDRARTRLAAELPALRASAAEMRAQAQEVTRLRALPARAVAGITPLSTLLASGTLTQGLPGARLSTLDGKRVRLVIDDASWTRLAEWISAAQSLHGLVVDTATVDALAAPGRVRADIVLVAP